jgi:hypothetical protein
VPIDSASHHHQACGRSKPIVETQKTSVASQVSHVSTRRGGSGVG